MSLVLVDAEEDYRMSLVEDDEENRKIGVQEEEEQQTSADADDNAEAGATINSFQLSNGSEEAFSFSLDLLNHIVEEFPRLEARVTMLEKENSDMRMENQRLNERLKVVEAKASINDEDGNGVAAKEAGTTHPAPNKDLLNMHETNQVENMQTLTLTRDEMEPDSDDNEEEGGNGAGTDSTCSPPSSELGYSSPLPLHRRSSQLRSKNNSPTSIIQTSKNSKPPSPVRNKTRNKMQGSSSSQSATTLNSSSAVDAEKRKRNEDLRESKTLENANEKIFKCSICPKSFSHKYNFNRHALTHKIGPKPFKCRGKACENTFLSKRDCRRHEERKHSEELGLIREKKEMCQLCGVMFYTSNELKIHMVTHSDARPFKCSICSHAFKTKCDLRQHMTTHSDVRRFKCSVCSNTFKKNDTLLRHMTVHSDARPFKCSICSQAFKRKADLLRHMAKHSRSEADANKTFKCSVCSYSCKLKANLSWHTSVVHRSQK